MNSIVHAMNKSIKGGYITILVVSMILMGVFGYLLLGSPLLAPYYQGNHMSKADIYNFVNDYQNATKTVRFIPDLDYTYSFSIELIDNNDEPIEYVFAEVMQDDPEKFFIYTLPKEYTLDENITTIIGKLDTYDIDLKDLIIEELSVYGLQNKIPAMVLHIQKVGIFDWVFLGVFVLGALLFVIYTFKLIFFGKNSPAVKILKSLENPEIAYTELENTVYDDNEKLFQFTKNYIYNIYLNEVHEKKDILWIYPVTVKTKAYGLVTVGTDYRLLYRGRELTREIPVKKTEIEQYIKKFYLECPNITVGYSEEREKAFNKDVDEFIREYYVYEEDKMASMESIDSSPLEKNDVDV